MNGAGLAKLTEGQKDCLRLVAHHLSSKEIARRLGISQHTVDQRLKVAMRTLAAESRFEAARLLTAHEGPAPHQPLVHQSPDIAKTPDAASVFPAFDRLETQSPRLVLREEQVPYLHLPLSQSEAADPVNEEGRNDLGVWIKLAAIIAIAVGSALAFGAILAGLEALSRLS
jgi:DNA-binding CsgD family transcriptional regulator